MNIALQKKTKTKTKTSIYTMNGMWTRQLEGWQKQPGRGRSRKQAAARQKNRKGYNNKRNSKRTEVKTKILTQQQQK